MPTITSKRSKPSGATATAVAEKASDDASANCSICLDMIVDATADQEGQDAVFCDGVCNGWIHRRCAGLSSTAFVAISSLSDSQPFYCPNCRLDMQSKEIIDLKASIQKLYQSISDLQSPSGTSAPAIAPISSNQDDNSSIDSPPVSRQNRVHNHHMPTSASPRSAPSIPPKPSLQHTRTDRKFNLVVYGVREQPKGTQRHIRSRQDEEIITLILSSIHSSISEYSVRDCFRLGKYSENRCRPVLTTLSRSNDVISVLANRRHLSHSSQYPHISIKPDLTPEARKVESILLKQRRELITSGTNPRDIKIRRDTLLINGRKHGVVVDSTFQLCPLVSDHVNAAFLSSQPNQSIITSSVSTPVTSSQPINTPTTETTTADLSH